MTTQNTAAGPSGLLYPGFEAGNHAVSLDGSKQWISLNNPGPLNFTGHSPLELLGVVFRIKGCRFPLAGHYGVQFWYDGQKVDERPLRLR